MATHCSPLTSQRVLGDQKKKWEAPVSASHSATNSTPAHTAIFSDRDARDPGASNGRIRPWLEAICASLTRVALANKLLMATPDASK